MKYELEEAVLEIERRAVVRRMRRIQRRTRRLSAACLTLFALLPYVLYQCVQPGARISGMTRFGAYMLPAEAGGYVLVGLISFVVAVVITITCIRWREKHPPEE